MAVQKREQYDVGIQQVLKTLDENERDAPELQMQIIAACERKMAKHADLLIAWYLDTQKAPERDDHNRSELQRALRMREAVQQWSRPGASGDDKPRFAKTEFNPHEHLRGK